jgi:SAM-dependent methyltransferase
MSEAVRRHAPATARNREPILDVLKRVVPSHARVLELAAGTGEHAAFFAPRLEVASWLPTDGDATSVPTIDAWAAHEKATVVLPARALDVEGRPWPIAPGSIDVVFCANMIHISPWSATLGLFDGAAALLEPGGLVVLYGPYKIGGAHTAPSNEAFDQSLRARDARWGVRDLERVIDVARERGFAHRETVAMPANNQTVVFGRS